MHTRFSSPPKILDTVLLALAMSKMVYVVYGASLTRSHHLDARTTQGSGQCSSKLEMLYRTKAPPAPIASSFVPLGDVKRAIRIDSLRTSLSATVGVPGEGTPAAACAVKRRKCDAFGLQYRMQGTIVCRHHLCIVTGR